MTDASKYTVEATETSLTILETLTDHDEPMGVTSLARELDSSKSVVHNHLSTLRARGYVCKVGGRYQPSLRTLNLGTRTRERLPLYRTAKPILENLATATGETTALFIKEGDWGVPVYVVEATGGWNSGLREGERLPLSVNAPGKAILASLPDDRVEEVVNAMELVTYTETTITDPDELRRQTRRIRDNGISFCRGEHQKGVVGVAAPIETGDDYATAALGVCGPADRLNGRYLEEDIAGQVLSTAKSIQVEVTR